MRARLKIPLVAGFRYIKHQGAKVLAAWAFRPEACPPTGEGIPGISAYGGSPMNSIIGYCLR